MRFGPVSFQPGEFAKIVLAIFFAVVSGRETRAARHGDVAPRSGRCCPTPSTSARSFWPGACAVVVMTAEKDLGSSLLFFALFIVMLWVATERGRLPRRRRRPVRQLRPTARGRSSPTCRSG